MLLYIGDGINKHILHKKMVAYSIASAREDGTANRVIMNGKPGYIGYSAVYLTYLEDGWIRLSGDNVEENNSWKLISSFELEPGTYTFTGMTGIGKETVALQLRIEDDTGSCHYHYQYDSDVFFDVERQADVTLRVRVYPNVEDVDILARPAVYRDE